MTPNWQPREKLFDNGVTIRTFWDKERALFRSVAIYDRRVLNEFTTKSAHEATGFDRLFRETWGTATSDNLKDEAQDAPIWVE